MNTFTPQPSTPDLHQRGDMGTIQHRYAIGPDSLLVSQFSYQRFDADVTANSNDPYQLLIETTHGGFFDHQRRSAIAPSGRKPTNSMSINLLGVHQFKIGIDYAHSNYDGLIRFDPVSILGNFKPSDRKDRVWAGIALHRSPKRDCMVPGGQMEAVPAFNDGSGAEIRSGFRNGFDQRSAARRLRADADKGRKDAAEGRRGPFLRPRAA